jgi:hypothetical protein
MLQTQISMEKQHFTSKNRWKKRLFLELAGACRSLPELAGACREDFLRFHLEN